METQSTGQPEAVVSLTPAVVKTKMEIALSSAEIGVQQLHDLEAGLIYNEDNLPQIIEVMAAAKRAVGVISTQHEKIKEPALRQCQTIDQAKRELDGLVVPVYEKIKKEYNKICKGMEDRMKQIAADQKRVDDIKYGMNKNLLYFAKEVGNAKTVADLIKVERLINLEKTRGDKYQEFFEEAIGKFNEILVDIKTQKVLLGGLNAQDALEEQKEAIAGQIQESKINLQERAINHATAVSEDAVPVLPNAPKAKRTTWGFEIKDILTLYKKHPELVDLQPNTQKIKELMAKLTSDGSLNNDIDYLSYDGITFTTKKTY